MHMNMKLSYILLLLLCVMRIETAVDEWNEITISFGNKNDDEESHTTQAEYTQCQWATSTHMKKRGGQKRSKKKMLHYAANEFI